MPALPGVPAMAALASLLHSLPTTRQSATESPAPDAAAAERSQSVVYLALGALIGVLYSLGTEKFMRAMQHRHVFVRNAMLWLAAVTWLVAAAAVAVIASLIYRQSGGGLEGFDRVLGVLLPFVVRADLVVDWAKRVAWALLNMANWTQAAVQTRRLLARAHTMSHLVLVDDEVRDMARRGSTRQDDLLESEDHVWKENTDSLIRFSDVLGHFEKLGRIAVYACGGLIGAIPAAIVWMFYAVYNGAVAMRDGKVVLASLYWLSVFLAPLGALIMVLASAGLLCGVVTLSVVGTVIQFAVYWSTRTVYSMVRVALSQFWAGFPRITKPHALPNIQQAPPGPNAGTFAVKAVREPEEAGAAIAQTGALLPTELEFALASWDGFHKGDKVKPEWLTTRMFKNLHLSLFSDDHSTLDGEAPLEKHRIASPSKETQYDASRERVASQSSKNKSPRALEPAGAEPVARTETTEGNDEQIDPPSYASMSNRSKRVGMRNNEKALVLLGRLGLDLSIRTTRQRRLSTYYAFGMLVSLQIESGGNAWRLQNIRDLSEEAFDLTMKSFNSIVTDEARVALQELLIRLEGSSRYRIVPTGAPNNRMVPVAAWLRTAMLAFLESPSESDGIKYVRDDFVGPGDNVR